MIDSTNIQLKDIADIIMGQSPSGDSCNVSKNGLPLLNGPTEFGSHHPAPIQYTTDPKKLSEDGDLLFCVRGSTTGRMNWSNQRYAIGRGLAAIRSKKNKKYSSFIKGCLEVSLPNLLMSATGSTFPSVSRDQLESIPIILPSSKKVEFIETILGTIDKKIALNNNTNETLEGIAKALFKSWFIDFDPVKAKAEGLSTGLPNEISDLFPNSFEDSNSDFIPTGWMKKNFGDFAIPKRGKIITKNTVTKGPIPVIAGGLNPSYFHNEYNVEGPVITISGSGANAGFVNLHFDNIWASDCSYISKIESKNIFSLFVFLKTFQRRIFDAQHGAAQPHVNPNDLMRLELIFPNQDIFDKFENLLNPLFLKIQINNLVRQKLEIIRDTLLPKLISGELRIPDAEKMIEEAGI